VDQGLSPVSGLLGALGLSERVTFYKSASPEADPTML